MAPGMEQPCRLGDGSVRSGNVYNGCVRCAWWEESAFAIRVAPCRIRKATVFLGRKVTGRQADVGTSVPDPVHIITWTSSGPGCGWLSETMQMPPFQASIEVSRNSSAAVCGTAQTRDACWGRRERCTNRQLGGGCNSDTVLPSHCHEAPQPSPLT